jgi:2-dehydro-3-deoxygluconokinase
MGGEGTRTLDRAQARTFDVIATGEATTNLTAPGGVSSTTSSALHFRPGGGAVTAALAMARAGLRVGLVTSLADDAFGRRVRARALHAGIDVGGVAVSRPRAGLVVLEGAGAAREIVPYRDEEVSLAVPDGWSAAVLLVAALSPVVAVGAALCKAARAARRRHATVVVDVHARWHLWAGRDPRAIHMVLREADVVHATTHDLAALGVDAEALRKMLRSEAVLVVTGATGEARATGPFGAVARGPLGPPSVAPDRAGAPFAAAICAELASVGAIGVHRSDVWERAFRRVRMRP